MYFDTSYIAKFYLKEAESPRVRALVRQADAVRSSLWALAEFHAVLHRHIRENVLSLADAREVAQRFAEDIADGNWILSPVTEPLLRRTGMFMLSGPQGMFIRAADAVHLTTALETGEREVWTNDRYMLAAAPHFGLTGKRF